MRAFLKRCLRQTRNWRTRAALGRRSMAGRIVLASTWDFPNPTHAYAYQEMLGLMDLGRMELGLDVCVLYGHRCPSQDVAARFAPLLQRAFALETLQSIHDADLRHLDHHHPGKVDAFLQRVSAATGRSLAALRADPMVSRASTFTRLCELANARYLQSWFFYDQSFMTMFAAQVLGIPRGISCHVDHVLDDHPWKLVPLQLATADLVLAISNRTREELLHLGGPDCAPRILVKRIGVAADLLRPVRARRTRRDGTFQLVSICRLEPKKGLLLLVDACELLRQRGRRFRVRLVGGEDPGVPTSAAFAAAVRQRIAALQLGDLVTLEGPVGNDGIPAVLAAADAFVAPYVELDSGDKDGIPTAIVEAMATGLPIVCSRVGAIAEAVTDGEQGLMVPQRDAAALAAAIERLADDTPLWNRLSAGAARRFDEEFDCRVTDRELHARVRKLVSR